MLAWRWAHVQFSQLTVFQDNYNQDAGNCKPDTRYIYSRYNKLPSLLATFVGGKFCAELLHWCPTSAASRRLTTKWHGVAGILSSMWFMACGMGATLLISSCLSLSFYPKKVFKLSTAAFTEDGRVGPGSLCSDCDRDVARDKESNQAAARTSVHLTTLSSARWGHADAWHLNQRIYLMRQPRASGPPQIWRQSRVTQTAKDTCLSSEFKLHLHTQSFKETQKMVWKAAHFLCSYLTF